MNVREVSEKYTRDQKASWKLELRQRGACLGTTLGVTDVGVGISL